MNISNWKGVFTFIKEQVQVWRDGSNSKSNRIVVSNRSIATYNNPVRSVTQ